MLIYFLGSISITMVSRLMLNLHSIADAGIFTSGSSAPSTAFSGDFVDLELDSHLGMDIAFNDDGYLYGIKDERMGSVQQEPTEA